MNQNKSIESRICEDLELTRSIGAGSKDAWHEFLETYCGLIYGVVKRHLFALEEEAVRSVYVDILKYFYDGNLSKYEGRATLASWLIVVSKCMASDYVRKLSGRYRTPKGYEQLDQFDREVLQLFYAERLSFDIVIQTLHLSGYSFTTDDLISSIQHIERLMDARYLERLEMEHRLRTSNAGSVSALKYLTRLNHENEERIANTSVDRALSKKEAETTAKEVWELISKLSEQEQKVIKLRFEGNKSAKEISKMMGLRNQRKAYTIIERATRKLKALMQANTRSKQADAEGRF